MGEFISRCIQRLSLPGWKREMTRIRGQKRRQNYPKRKRKEEEKERSAEKKERRELEKEKEERRYQKEIAKEEEDSIHDVWWPSLELDGEEDDELEADDTCNDIQEKITEYLKMEYVTRARVLKNISKNFKKNPRRFSSSQLFSFMSKTRPLAGNTQSIFYASYVFFERLREREIYPRQKKERAWRKYGVSRVALI
jgi:hypothetical protein